MKYVKNIMRIEKFKKLKNNEYEVIIDSKKIILYADIIIKYNLLAKKNIDSLYLSKIVNENNDLNGYYLSLNYINKKLRCEKEIEEFLKRKNFTDVIINKTIKKLKENKLLDRNLYIKSYINDQINLSSNGPKKIKINLINLGFSNNEIDEYLNTIDNSIFEMKIKKLIEKKLKSNNNSSNYNIKQKITNYLINLGYEKKDISNYINNIKFSETEILERKAKLILKKIKKTETDINKIKNKLKAKLYSQGFSIDEINQYINNL